MLLLFPHDLLTLFLSFYYITAVKAAFYSSAAFFAISFSCTSDGACSYLANVYS